MLWNSDELLHRRAAVKVSPRQQITPIRAHHHPTSALVSRFIAAAA